MLFEYLKPQFTTGTERKQFVKILSHIIEADSSFEPYPPIKSDDFYWTLDSGNNWKVTFYEYNPSRFSVNYRYQCNAVKAEESLGEWLKYRLGCTPIE